MKSIGKQNEYIVGECMKKTTAQNKMTQSKNNIVYTYVEWNISPFMRF